MKNRWIILILLMLTRGMASYAFSLPKTKAIPVGVLGIVAAIFTEKENSCQLLNELMEEEDAYYNVLVEDHPMSKRLQYVTHGMQAASQIPLNYKVYDEEDIVNAFAVANGSIRVFSGLMELLSDDELMAVLAHELGHIVLGHAMNAYKSQMLKMSLNKLNPLSKYTMGNMANSLVFAKYSRAQETEADLYAYAYLRNHRVDPCAIIYSLATIRSLEETEDMSLDLFADHPSLTYRIETLMEYARKDGYIFDIE